MIDWNRHSYAAIKSKWGNFLRMRTIKSNGKWHITCLERESLIENLMKRLDEEMTKNFKESIGK